MVERRSGLHDSGSIHCFEYQHEHQSSNARDHVHEPLVREGTGGTSSCRAASSFARAERCDSEKLRNFSMLNRLVRAFSGCTGGDCGRSAEETSFESREAGIASSLVGRGEEGGASEGARTRGVCSPSSKWRASYDFVGTRSSTLRRRSRGMAGMRDY